MAQDVGHAIPTYYLFFNAPLKRPELTDTSTDIAREIIDVLLATQNHEIIILSRRVCEINAGHWKRTSLLTEDSQDPTVTDKEEVPGVTWVKVDYADKTSLVNILDGVHTILSFIVEYHAPESVAQKALIDAAVIAGVKRFAPNEWSR